MKHSVLVIGSGGREHTIVHALSRSPQVGTIYCAPGNAGIAEQAQCVPISDTDVPALLAFAQSNAIDLTVVGPEAALSAGVVDAFRAAGLPIFGHTQAATAIESSKEFAKRLMDKYQIPTAGYRSFSDFPEALRYLEQHSYPVVIKYDGLAAGKGVVVAETHDQAEQALRDMLLDKSYGDARVLIEDYLTGPEFSFMCFVSGSRVYPMPLAQDHKRALDGGHGANTGGMGAYTPLPFITKEDEAFALEHILRAAAVGMVAEGTPLTGVLYGGLMKTPTGIQVIEFNARFGDPETEVVLPLLDSDAYEVFYSIATGKSLSEVRFHEQATVGVVMASKGYPAHYEKGYPIAGTEHFDGLIFHMGTKSENGQLLTNGGRVLMCIATADSVREAQAKVYHEIEKIHCDNLFYRKDIAHQAL